jgi:hypothetical protein
MTIFKVTNVVVASTGVYTGVGISRSVKQAKRIACCKAYDNLAIGDAKANYCSGIAADYIVIRNIKTDEVVYNGMWDSRNW